METERLIITPFDYKDDAHCQCFADLYNELGRKTAGGNTFDMAAAREECYERMVVHSVRPGHGAYVIKLKEDGSLVGTVSLLRERKRTGSSYGAPDVGFATSLQHRGKGYAPEAVARVLEYATNELQLPNVFGFTAVDNGAARKVFEKCNMKYCGDHELSVFGDHNCKDAVYSLDADIARYGVP